MDFKITWMSYSKCWCVQKGVYKSACVQEEGVRLRRVMAAETAAGRPAAAAAPQAEGHPIPAMVYLVAAVILGLLFGKFLL